MLLNSDDHNHWLDHFGADMMPLNYLNICYLLACILGIIVFTFLQLIKHDYFTNSDFFNLLIKPNHF